jgi:hypothetical protein
MDVVTPSAYITKDFEIMRPILAEFVSHNLQQKNKSDWWRQLVLFKMGDVYQRDLPFEGSFEDLVKKMDIFACLKSIENNWYDVFKYTLTRSQRTWAHELLETRNSLAHVSDKIMNDEDAARALDTMFRFMEPIDQENAEELRKLLRQVRYMTEKSSTDAAFSKPTVAVKVQEKSITETTMTYASPWRLIAEPHPDVARGDYRQAEFAADLSQVIRGNAVMEYQDPVEFFARTYITEGMKGMLSKAAMRIAGKGGEPVIQLKTVFGGGKTHSMLALYHLMRSTFPQTLMGVPEILKSAGITTMPKVKVAVLVGTALSPAKPRKSANFPGITINTLWGEMAAQLAEQSGNPKLYEYIKEDDKKGTSPGSDALRALFDACGPCMILIDELVAYARKLYGYHQGELPAGTFDNVLSFAQELTEAARKSKNSIVVAAIPESEIEEGGEAGKIALERIEHIFGRMETIWKPVVSEEGFEIVRRRLFKNITDQDAVDKTCNAYFNIYKNNPDFFPIECREADYLTGMKKCYPIHPEIFNRLYEDWATIEHFQKTHGVLRLMAAVIYDLYSNNDSGAMIMPGSIAIGKPGIREELTRYLSDGWNPIIENEIDGKNSQSVKLDSQGGGYYGKYFASSHVARAIFLGSAPDVREMSNRGINANQIRLGVVQPEENIPAYNDALASLSDKLTYLYRSADNRYWFDTRPTLKKTVADRARIQTLDEIVFALESELKNVCRSKEPFEAVHLAPSHSGDIPDSPSIRLVLLTPAEVYKHDDKNCFALTVAKDYYENRGNSPRIYRNRIAFLAPDGATMDQLKQDMRLLMAWRSIEKDIVNLNLDNAQQREVKDAIEHSERTIRDRIQDAYSWLLIPIQDGTGPVTWSISRIPGISNPVTKAAQKMREEESLIDTLSSKIISMEMIQFDLWKNKNHLQVRELWEDYTRYIYLHRVKNQEVLFRALESGILSGEYFAYADGQDASGRYEALCLGNNAHLHITLDGLLVKPEAAKAQIEKEKAIAETASASTRALNNPCEKTGASPSHGPSYADGNLFGSGKTPSKQPSQQNKPTHFYGSVNLDVNKIGQTAGTINQEVLQHFRNFANVEIAVKLDVHVKIPEGVSEDVARTIRENCRTLKFINSEFE